MLASSVIIELRARNPVIRFAYHEIAPLSRAEGQNVKTSAFHSICGRDIRVRFPFLIDACCPCPKCPIV